MTSYDIIEAELVRLHSHYTKLTDKFLEVDAELGKLLLDQMRNIDLKISHLYHMLDNNFYPCDDIEED